MQRLRAPIHYVQGCGEEIPVRTASIDLVICCNVLDHVSDPDAVLREIHRVLKSDGCLYFDVDTFSLCGLVKWYLWTRHAHKDEILVTSHPYRLFEDGLVRRLRGAGFHLRKLGGHNVVSKIIGRAQEIRRSWLRNILTNCIVGAKKGHPSRFHLTQEQCI